MKHIDYQVDFASLRNAYTEVTGFLEAELGEKVESVETKIEENLLCFGSDNYRLLEKFVNTYNLDKTGFDYSKHFLSDRELFIASTAVWMVTIAPLFVFTWLVRIITFNKIDWTNNAIFPKVDRPTMDMTVGDMVIWYVTGKYNLRSNVVVAVQKPTYTKGAATSYLPKYPAEQLAPGIVA